nr:glycosyltransferase [Anaerolineae bacterium]
MAEASKQYRWAVLNQSQGPAFQQMLERLSDELGSCLLFTGMPFPMEDGKLDVQAASAYDRRNLPRRLWSWMRFALVSFAGVLRLPGQPFLLVVTNPPFLPHVAWIAHKLRGNPYGLLVWDIYPDHVIKMGWIRTNGLVARLWNRVNARVMLDARVVITLGDRMREALERQLGRNAAELQIDVIPNWADTNLLRPMAKLENRFAMEHDQVDKVTVLYSGNMGITHGLETLVESAGMLRGDPRISFLLIGDGLGREQIEGKVVASGLSNVKLLPRQPWENLPHSLAAGDIAVVTQAPGSEHLSLPSKVYSLMAAGCAVVA